MQLEGIAITVSHTRADGRHPQPFKGGNAVAAVKPPELAIHLQHVNRLPLALGRNRGHQGGHLGLIETALERAADGGQGQGGEAHGEGLWRAVTACPRARTVPQRRRYSPPRPPF